MGSTEFAEAARDVCAGKIEHGEFVRRVDGWVRGHARGMEVRYGRVPSWLGRQDLEQELRIQLWRHALKYDPDRGTVAAPDKYLSFAARKSVMKRVQKAQGLEQHRRSGPPRFEICSGDTYEHTYEFSGVHGPQQAASELGEDPLEEASRAEQYAVLRGLCDTSVERECVGALERGDGDASSAGALLWADRATRFRLRLGSETEATRMVRVVVERLMRDYGKEATR